MDQVVLSGTNFLVGFLLIRFTTDQDYGLYVLVQSSLLFAVTLHNAWLAAPLAILSARLPPEERRYTIGSVKRAQRRVLLMSVLPLLALTALGFWSKMLSGLLASVLAAGILAGWAALRREYLRSVLLMYSRPHALLGADSMYAVSLLLGVVGAVYVGVRVGGIHVVVLVACLLGVAALAGEAKANRSLAIDPGWPKPGKVAIWPQLRQLGYWSLLGASIYWFLGQSYSYLLASRLNLKAVADVNAIRLLVSPAIVLTVGVGSLLGPSAAKWYVQIGIHRLVRRLLLLLLGAGILEVLYIVVVWFGRSWLIVDVLHKHIQASDRLLLLWSGVAIVALCRDMLQCALAAMGQLRSLAWQVGISTAVALVIMWYGLAWWGEAAVLIGQIVGEVINLAGIIFLLRKSMRTAS